MLALENFPHTGRPAAAHRFRASVFPPRSPCPPFSALDKHRGLPAPRVREPWSRFPKHGREEFTQKVPCFLGLVVLAGLLLGCGSDSWFGSGPGAEASVNTPSGVQSGLVRLAYTLKSEDVSTTDIQVSYSEGGGPFRRATEGAGGSGTKNLTVSTAGDSHTFVWDSGADIEGSRSSLVVLRVQPENGAGSFTGALSVHNSRFVVAAEDRAIGRVRLYLADVVDGSLTFKGSFSTGGTQPHDVLHESGFFFVAHTSSNNVAAFQVDEGTESLLAVEDSPFSADGAGSKYLASDGEHVFVANTAGGTVTVFNLASSGKLTLNVHSGLSAAGCGAMVARSGRLYVASETTGGILIFDIDTDGELVENGFSPVMTGGLSSPRALVSVGSRIYAANASAGSICGFNYLGGGDLSPLGGSPFAVSSSGIEALARNGTKLFAVTGVGEELLALTVDSFGALTEDSASPFVLGGPAFTVVTAGSIAFAATTTSKEIESLTINELGVVEVSGSSPEGVGVEIVRMALSD